MIVTTRHILGMFKARFFSIYRNNQLTSLRMSSTSIIGYAEDDVLFITENLSKLISLNRPKKLNSLNTSMVSKITPRLLEYSKSSITNLVILTSNSPKGLCAGGDVAECAKQIKEGNPGYASNFFQQEYNTNYLIGTYDKPYVSLMNGITMGGGVGLSVHAPFRVATETTKLAMPEMDIGFFPDVGTTFFLPRLDDKLGYYFALTGEILSGLDAYFAGFATHYVPSDRLPQLITRLSNLQPPTVNDTPSEHSEIGSSREYFAQVNEVIDEFSDSKIPDDYKFPLSVEERKLVKEAFSQPTVEGALETFMESGTEFGKKVIKKLQTKPTLSLKVAFALMKRGEKNTIKKQLELEMITATNIMNIKPAENDFVKGVSHKLIDKIKNPPHPEWNSGELVSDAVIQKLLTRTEHSLSLEKPLINEFFDIDYKEYPFNMGLPTVTQVKNYVTGNDGSGRSYLPTPQEVYRHFTKESEKPGIEFKIKQILEVHGESSKFDNKYVAWRD